MALKQVPVSIIGNPLLWRGQRAKTSAYTVLAKDNGVLFTNEGATASVTFTLPALKRGLFFFFFVAADYTVTVASAAGDDVVAPGDASADSLAFSTPGDKLGGFLMVWANADATKWYSAKFCPNAMTINT